eukprot:TRINITY_DN31962_c0_g1_i1.p2 TRINITY_DN31962_c0_g1~~TRINITY_DN31962_c0_g1_i1.p2  ORF type:complete len:226 (+),score=39.53 TRINITY_DN31962_c0_g1_i1:64-741(+)
MPSEPNLNALSQYKYPKRVKIESKIPVRTMNADSPGPRYAPIDTTLHKHTRAPAVSMGARLQGPEKEGGVPGPGQYGCAKPTCIQLGKGFGFGSAPRLQMKKTKDLPGPGAYSVPTSLGGVHMSFGGGVQEQGKAAGNPGPGAYKPNFVQVERGETKVAFTQFLGTEEKKEVPGPGQYSLPSTLGGNNVMKRCASYSFTSAGWQADKSDKNGGKMIPAPTTFKLP